MTIEDKRLRNEIVSQGLSKPLKLKPKRKRGKRPPDAKVPKGEIPPGQSSEPSAGD